MSLPALNDQQNKMRKAFNKAFSKDDYMKWLNIICRCTFPTSVMEKIKVFLPREETSEERDLRKSLGKNLGRATCEEYDTWCDLRNNHSEYTWIANALMTNITEHILSGMYQQRINLCPGLYRTHMITHIKRMSSDMKTRLSLVCEMHPVYLRQLFDTRSTFKELMMVPQRLDKHLKESTSLPDFFDRRKRILAAKGKGLENTEKKKQPTTPCEKAYHLIQTYFYNEHVSPDFMLYNMWYVPDLSRGQRGKKHVETSSMFQLRRSIEEKEAPTQELEDQCALFVSWCKVYRFDERENKTSSKRDVDQCIELISSAFRSRGSNSSSSSSSSSSSNSSASSSNPVTVIDFESNPLSLDDAIARARENHLAREKERKEKEESAKKLKLEQKRQKAKSVKTVTQTLSNGKKGKK